MAGDIDAVTYTAGADAHADLWVLTADVPTAFAQFFSDAIADDCLSTSLDVRRPRAPSQPLQWIVDAKPSRAMWEKRFTVLANAIGQETSTIHIEKLPHKNWVLEVQKSFTPISAARCYIHGTHHAPKEGAVNLCLDAGMAFGSGEHATTQGCLLAIDALAEQEYLPASIVDVGTGSGILAMAAKRCWPKATVVASDIDDVAVQVAEENAARNGVAVTCITADGMDAPAIIQHTPYQIIIANILAKPLITLAPAIAASTAAGGYVILSGLLARQQPDVQAAYETEALALVTTHPIEEWTTLVFRKEN